MKRKEKRDRWGEIRECFGLTLSLLSFSFLISCQLSFPSISYLNLTVPPWSHSHLWLHGLSGLSHSLIPFIPPFISLMLHFQRSGESVEMVEGRLTTAHRERESEISSREQLITSLMTHLTHLDNSGSQVVRKCRWGMKRSLVRPCRLYRTKKWVIERRTS